MKLHLKELLGEIDIYLFDQILKGRFENCLTILDAGCGYGRNLIYFLNNNFNVHGVDVNAVAIQHMQQLSNTF